MQGIVRRVFSDAFPQQLVVLAILASSLTEQVSGLQMG